eukprot:542575_1
MSTNQSSITWTDLTACPSTIGGLVIPTGRDANNYIVIDYKAGWTKINCILYKYNIKSDKWIKKDFNNTENVTNCFAALDIKKQILYLFIQNSVTQMTLDYNHIRNDSHKKYLSSSTSIIANDSLFIIGGEYNNSILEWNSECKTFTKYSDMYNEIHLGDFAMTYNHKNNCILLFGGFDWD